MIEIISDGPFYVGFILLLAWVVYKVFYYKELVLSYRINWKSLKFLCFIVNTAILLINLGLTHNLPQTAQNPQDLKPLLLTTALNNEFFPHLHGEPFLLLNLISILCLPLSKPDPNKSKETKSEI